MWENSYDYTEVPYRDEHEKTKSKTVTRKSRVELHLCVITVSTSIKVVAVVKIL